MPLAHVFMLMDVHTEIHSKEEEPKQSRKRKHKGQSTVTKDNGDRVTQRWRDLSNLPDDIAAARKIVGGALGDGIQGVDC